MRRSDTPPRATSWPTSRLASMSLTKTGWENGRRRHPGIAGRFGENYIAETIGADLQQGVRVYVEGRLVRRAWVDRENRKHHYTEVGAKGVRLLDTAASQDGT